MGKILGNILWLDEIVHESTAGSKAFRLAQLKRSGFPVPNGLVLATPVYDNIFSPLRGRIDSILASAGKKPEHLEKASREIRSLIGSQSIPPEIEKEILLECRKLKGPFAVRSSATAEDLEKASFAGQMESFLNVSLENLIESVKNCMSSIFSPRAIYYRKKLGIDHFKVSSSVLVQEMVNSQKSGVVFSVNPLGSDEILIEAGAGFGSEIVSGSLIPDSYAVSRSNSEIKIIRVGGNSALLNNEEISTVADYVKKIEALYNQPQDVEWTFDHNGKFFILQSRPITVLP